MAYCTVADIEGYSGMAFTTETRPKKAAVETMISDNDGKINAELTKQGITPPTSGYGFTALKQIAQYCVLADVCRANHTESETVDKYADLCTKGIEDIQNNPGLYDTSMIGSVSGSTKEEPVYGWGEKQW